MKLAADQGYLRRPYGAEALTTAVTIKFTASDFRSVRSLADHMGLSVAELVRKILREHLLSAR